MLRKHFAALSPLQPFVALQHKNHKVIIPYFLPLYKIFRPDARKVCTREQMAIRQWKAKRAETCSICRINTIEANTHAEVKNHCSPNTCQISLGNPHASIKSELPKFAVSALPNWYCHYISWGWHIGNHEAVVHWSNFANFCKSAILFKSPSYFYFPLDKPACQSYTGDTAI